MDDERLDYGDERALPTRLARTVWRDLPSVVVRYHRGDDALTVEVVDIDPGVELESEDGRLLVEFDRDDGGAFPVRLTVTGLRADPSANALRHAREVLGGTVWGVAAALVDGPGEGSEEIWLDRAHLEQWLAGWRRLAEGLRGPLVIGVEVRREIVRAVLVPEREVLRDDVTVLAEAEQELELNDPESVVAAILAVLDEIVATSPDPRAARCAVGVQIGGPVVDGVVKYYYKRRADGKPTEPWRNIPLAARLGAATGRAVRVANDAEAFATFVSARGEYRRFGSFVVVTVRHGVGARLVECGQVMRYPMELGTMLPFPGMPLSKEPAGHRSRDSIEAISGSSAIVERVRWALHADVHSIEEVTELVAVDGARDEVIKAFAEAGQGLARSVAAAQAMVRPDAWVVFGSTAMTDETTVTGRAYMDGIREFESHLDWHDLAGRDEDGEPGATVVIIGRQLGCRMGPLSAATVGGCARSPIDPDRPTTRRG